MASVVVPARFPGRVLRFRNQRGAERIGLGALTESEWEAHFAAFAVLPDNLPEALALRYHGHQFMAYNPALGPRAWLAARTAQARLAHSKTANSPGTVATGR